jgi:hypothetical protein
MQQLVFSLNQQLHRLVSDYQRKHDEPLFTEQCIDLVSGHMRHLLTGDEVRRHLAKHSYAQGLRLKQGDQLLGSGPEYERHLVEFWNELFTAAGFVPPGKGYDTAAPQTITARITRMFVKEKSRPAAKLRLEGNVRAAALEFCSGLYDGAKLGQNLTKLAVEHLRDALTVNKTVVAEVEALAKRHGVVFRTPDGKSASGEGHQALLRDYLLATIETLIEKK